MTDVLEAQGIHDHPDFKIGVIPHGISDEKLLHINWRADTGITIPDVVDNMAGVTAGLDDNDKIGDCGPTAIDNHNRVTTRFTGDEVDAQVTAVLRLYTAATVPPYNPVTGANDNGVSNVNLLKAVATQGLNGKKIVAYAKLTDMTDESIMTAIYLFKCVLVAVTLDKAQQVQSSTQSPVWDYVAGSPVWGGHDICAGAYDKTEESVDVFSWAMRVKTTPKFRQNQLSEVWVPIWPEVLTNPLFSQLVDTETLAAEFKGLTGGVLDFPVAPTPAPPAPKPAPIDPVTGLTLSITDSEVIEHLQLAAARSKLTEAEQLTKTLRSYYKIKD